MLKKKRRSLFRLLPEEKGVYNSGNDVVKGVGSGGDSETANRKEDREVDAGHSPKTNFRPVEIRDASELPVDEGYVVMRAEQRGGNED